MRVCVCVWADVGVGMCFKQANKSNKQSCLFLRVVLVGESLLFDVCVCVGARAHILPHTHTRTHMVGNKMVLFILMAGMAATVSVMRPHAHIAHLCKIVNFSHHPSNVARVKEAGSDNTVPISLATCPTDARNCLTVSAKSLFLAFNVASTPGPTLLPPPIITLRFVVWVALGVLVFFVGDG